MKHRTMSILPHWLGLNFDPRIEDPEKLQQISRRAFGRLLSGATVGATLFSTGCRGVDRATGNIRASPDVPAPGDEQYWSNIADQFLIRKDRAYMNSGARGPSPEPVHRAQLDALVGIQTDYPHYAQDIYDFRAALREKLAQFVGAKPAEIAYTDNTTEGMIFGTEGVALNPGDEVLYTNHDHDAGANPILYRAAREGLDVKVIDLSDSKYHPPKSPNVLIDAFDKAITRRTKLISFCHINYTDGSVMPVKAICELARAKGVATMVDGAQPPGMMKLDLHDLGCDMYAGAMHKWTLAAMRTGFFYVREDFLDRVRPVLYAGPTDHKTMYGTDVPSEFRGYYTGIRKFEERGSFDIPAEVSINAALDFHNGITRQRIEARIRYLATRLHQGLDNIDGVELYSSAAPSLSSGLVSWVVKGVPTHDLTERLWKEHGIYIRNVTHKEIGFDANRASCHIMVTTRHIDKLIGAIEEIARKR